ncbi:hypothetical protein BO70DRAFT_366831 [Aspergillus heteromorphus CBS 117.55]|uniref:Uncharacterized protein n=1 Tax=Aspergillus heteromorphus CBS 117.55 TaxID=1448321 RepID=A0A317UWZ0_9EURO|nr:uncharacterized protein BO70DRAFT_366831 [Aspergillus heteromorphus CBS 117.55]PWY65032.1 hypothetical protein BO70DRAFT_366831 [Aspergillus heteromorphus CBS 117.55]
MENMPDADPDTRAEVDLMILDYIVCTTIELALYHGKEKSEGRHPSNRSLSWQFNTTNSTRTVLLHPDPLPRDMNIKIQVLEFAQLFFKNLVFADQEHAPSIEVLQDGMCTDYVNENTVTENQTRPSRTKLPSGEDRLRTRNAYPCFHTLVELITLCSLADKKLPGDIIEHFVALAAWDVYRLEDRSPNGYKIFMSHASERLHGTPYARFVQEYLSNFQPPIDPPPGTRTGTPPQELLQNKLQRSVFDFLACLMKTLDSPVLIQLERGKLVGLSREETEQLKGRVGL